MVAAVVAKKPPVAKSPDKTPPRRTRGDRSSKNASPLDVSVGSSARKAPKLACLIVPKHFNADSEEVTVYELGSKSVELEMPTFQINIAPKLQYSLIQANGDACPSMIHIN